MTLKELAQKINELYRQEKGDCLVYVQIEEVNKNVSYPLQQLGQYGDSGPNIIILKG
jgi:hypothetical protein